ncbi:MAG TPA: hypothetical protein VF939_18790 [Puia sp.]
MRKKTMKRIGIIILSGVIIVAGIVAFMWFKPRRNVQATTAYAELKVQDLVNQFSADVAGANAKYLASDGNSKVLIVIGRISNISTNQNGDKVIVLKDPGAKVGVSATFTPQTSPDAESVKVGDMIRIKGAITAGNRYDPDLDLYEHAVLVQCDIVK